jgi:hypothetical protein
MRFLLCGTAIDLQFFEMTSVVLPGQPIRVISPAVLAKQYQRYQAILIIQKRKAPAFMLGPLIQ